MENNNNIDTIFRKVVEQSADFYDTKAERAKERIWNHVKPVRKIQWQNNLIRILSAACVLLLFCTIVLSVSFIKAKGTLLKLAELNQSIKNDTDIQEKPAFAMQTPDQEVSLHSTDTIYIEKKVIVYQPVVTRERVVDTVFQTQLVYTEKTQSPEALPSATSNAEADRGYQNKIPFQDKEIMISNNEKLKPERRKKFQIRIGGERNQDDNVPLALTVKL